MRWVVMTSSGRGRYGRWRRRRFPVGCRSARGAAAVVPAVRGPGRRPERARPTASSRSDRAPSTVRASGPRRPSLPVAQAARAIAPREGREGGGQRGSACRVLCTSARIPGRTGQRCTLHILRSELIPGGSVPRAVRVLCTSVSRDLRTCRADGEPRCGSAAHARVHAFGRLRLLPLASTGSRGTGG